MSEITPETVRHLGHLARIELSDAEVTQFASELDRIVGAIQRIAQVATPEVPATSHPVPMSNVFRDDVVGQTLTLDEALSGAPDHDGSRFRVTAILGEEAE